MAKITRTFGILMIVLGLIAYFGSGMVSMTALIPAFFGAAILACALLSARLGKPALIGALVLAVLGVLGPAGRVVPMAARGELPLNTATVVQIAFAVLSLVLSVLLARGLFAKK